MTVKHKTDPLRPQPAPPPLISRRQLLATGVALLAGCARHDADKVTIHFWNGFTGPDGRTMLRMVQRFNAANPDIYVLMQRMDWATYYNKIFVAGMGKRAPELFVLHTSALPRFALANFVRPIDDIQAGPSAIDSSDIPPTIWHAGDIKGKHYGVPLDIHPMGLYYNLEMLAQAGISAPPATREQFISAAIKMTDRAKDRWGFCFTNFESNVYTVMRQFGGEFFTPDGTQCVMNNPQNVAALQFCRDLIAKYKVAPEPQDFDSWIGFRQGRVGMVFEGVYMLADLVKQEDLRFAGAPAPQFGAKPAVWANSHNLCFRADLQGAKLQAAWRFVRYLSDNSLSWAAGGQVPARNSLRSTPEFAKMTVQSQFAREVPYVTYMPAIPFNFEFATEFNVAIEKALRGTQSPQQALDTAVVNVNKVLARDKANTALGGAR